MTIKHAKQSGLPADENNDAHVEPSDWYADHVATGYFRDYDILTYSGGDISVTSASLVALPGGPHDISVTASTGDLLMVGLSARADASAAGNIGFDAPTMVGGSPVNYISGATSIGVSAWFIGGSALVGVGGEVPYVVQSGDISSGTVTLRLYARTSATRTVNAASDGLLKFWVRNLGQ